MYALQSSIWNNLHPNQVIGKPAVIKEMDCLTATVEEIREVRAQVSLPINKDRTRLAALAGWFDVHFRVCQAELLPSSPHVRIMFYSTVDAHSFTLHFQGSQQNPAVEEVELNTAPDENGGTHWGQQVGF